MPEPITLEPSPTEPIKLFEGQWNLPRCFVIHAWSPPGIKHVIESIRSALKGTFYVRADLDFGSGDSIRQRALQEIRTASLVICILDDLPANVTFELGYAQALDKPCILLKRNGAQVNVRKYFNPCPAEVNNPLLDIDKHFSDQKDVLYVTYDHEDPKSPVAVLNAELAKRNTAAKTLGRRVIELWTSLLVDRLAVICDPEPLEDYILSTTRTITLGKPLFATIRKRNLDRAYKACLDKKPKRRGASQSPTGLSREVIQVLADVSPEMGIEVADKLLRTYKNDDALLFIRGNWHHELHHWLAAITDYSTVINLPNVRAKRKAQAYVNRGVAKGMSGNTVGEIADYSAVIDMPDAPADQKAQAYVNRGVAKGKSGDTVGEIADYSAVIDMPDAPADLRAQAYVNRGVAKGKSGDTVGEIADYSAVIDMPDAPADEKARAYFNRGVAKRQSGDTAGAIADYSAVIDMPDAPADQKAKAYVNRGLIRLGTDDPGGCEDLRQASAIFQSLDMSGDVAKVEALRAKYCDGKSP